MISEVDPHNGEKAKKTIQRVLFFLPSIKISSNVYLVYLIQFVWDMKSEKKFQIDGVNCTLTKDDFRDRSK